MESHESFMLDNTYKTSILRTRLKRPPVTDDLVPRRQLVQELETGLRRPFTLVSAPAGYGKTTLLSSWLQETGHPHLWYSLEPGDNDLHTFLSYLFTGLQDKEPQIGKNILELLSLAKLPPLSRLSEQVVNELDRVSSFLVVVLDDYHFIKNQEIHTILSTWLRHPPRQVHLVISARQDPPLPLAWLRARNQVTDIRVSRLRFSREEMQSFLQHHIDTTVPEHMLAALEEKTEGWITALRLITLYLQQMPDLTMLLQKLSRSYIYFNEYFFNEIMNLLPSSIKEFLLQTSILNRFNKDLCDALFHDKSGIGESGANIEWIFRNNLFIEMLGEDELWYRYHHLFQQWLQQQLTQSHSKEEIRELHHRASHWFRENGFPDEAIEHALQAGEVMDAVQIVEENLTGILSADRWWVLQKWLNRLPEKVRNQHIKLVMGQAWIYYLKDLTASLPALLEQIEKLIAKQPVDDTTRGEIEFFKGYMDYWLHPGEEMDAHFRKAFQWIPRTFSFSSSCALVYRALALQASGRMQEAQDFLNDLLTHVEETNYIFRSRIWASFTYIHLLNGDLTAARNYARQLAELADATENKYVGAWADYLLGFWHFQRYEISRALPFFKKVLEQRYIFGARPALDGMMGLAMCYRYLGEEDSLPKTLQLIDDFVRHNQNPILLNVANSFYAHLALDAEELTTAGRWVRSIDLHVLPINQVFWLENPFITRLRYLLKSASAAELPQVIARIEKELQFYRRLHNVPRSIELLILLARAYQKNQQLKEAQKALQRAVELACAGGWIYPFVEAGESIAELLPQIPVQGEQQYFVRELLHTITNRVLNIPETEKAGDSRITREEKGIATYHNLTNREMDVLVLLSRRFSNKEIATQLAISPGTVKRHTLRIYQKLGVGNRRQAVQKALALGILNPSDEGN